jgi:hypothetical protein
METRPSLSLFFSQFSAPRIAFLFYLSFGITKLVLFIKRHSAVPLTTPTGIKAAAAAATTTTIITFSDT